MLPFWTSSGHGTKPSILRFRYDIINHIQCVILVGALPCTLQHGLHEPKNCYQVNSTGSSTHCHEHWSSQVRDRHKSSAACCPNNRSALHRHWWQWWLCMRHSGNVQWTLTWVMAVSRGPEGTVEPFGKDAPICDSDSAVALVTKHKLGISDLLNLFFWGGWSIVQICQTLILLHCFSCQVLNEKDGSVVYRQDWSNAHQLCWQAWHQQTRMHRHSEMTQVDMCHNTGMCLITLS